MLPLGEGWGVWAAFAFTAICVAASVIWHG